MIATGCALGVLLLALGLRYRRAGLARLARLELRGSLFALAALAAQTIAISSQQRVVWLVPSLACLTAFCWLNRRHAGMRLVFAGALLNLTVMLANGGVMPVAAAKLSVVLGAPVAERSALVLTKSAVIEDNLATLAWLGDRLLLPGPMSRLAVWSIGDFVLLAGVAGLLRHTMQGSSHASVQPDSRAAKL